MSFLSRSLPRQPSDGSTRFLGWVLVVLVFCSTGCSTELQDLCDGFGGAGEVGLESPSRRSQIVGGETPAHFDVAPHFWRNVVVLRPAAAELSEAGLCSGVHLSPRIVLTAAHCLADGPLVVSGEDVEAMSSHPTLDLGLVLLPERSCPSSRALGVPVAWETPPLNAEVLLAGFGLAEDETTGALLVVQEPVFSIDEPFLRVHGEGKSGACYGDSGGPLLSNENGPRLIGILSAGEASCRGLDEYVLVSSGRQWIQSQTELWGFYIE